MADAPRSRTQGPHAIRVQPLKWKRLILPLTLAGILAACGGGGSGGGIAEGLSTETHAAATQSASDRVAAENMSGAKADAAKVACSHAHVYITVESIRVMRRHAGGEQWSDLAMGAPRRIDLMNLGGGVLQALGVSLLSPGHYGEVRLVLVGDDGMAHAVQPAGEGIAPLTVPSGAQSGLKLKGDFQVPAGQAGDLALAGFNPCDQVVQAGNRSSPRYHLKPVLEAVVHLGPVASEKKFAAGTVLPVMGGGHVTFREAASTSWVVQRHDAGGQALGPEVTLTPALMPGDWTNEMRIVPLAGGGYAAMWLRLLQFDRFGGSLYQIYTQSFTSSGTPIGSPFAVASTIPARFFISQPIGLPKVATLADGGYVIVWGLQSETDSAVYAQRFTAAGMPAGNVQQVAAEGNGYFSVTGLATGGYLVTWTNTSGEGLARAYSATDVPLGEARSTGPSYIRASSHYPTSLVPLAGGGALMVWLRSESAMSSMPFVHIVQFASDGTPMGPARIVDERTATSLAHGSAPAAAGLADGGFVVAWIEGGEVHARRFAADGSPTGGEARVNMHTTDAQEPLAVVALAGGGFMITWSGIGPDGVRSNHARVYPASSLLGTP